MLRASPKSKYFGFDLFEDATPETDLAEMNVKPHNKLKNVRALLRDYDVTLVKGNTRQTLATFNEPVDFVWLDGGHSVETVRSDWENVKRCLMPEAVVLLDDYYTGKQIDTAKFGCNELLKGLKHAVLPMADPVQGGGWVQIAQVFP
jgi:hypothetical protein